MKWFLLVSDGKKRKLSWSNWAQSLWCYFKDFLLYFQMV